MLFYRKWAERKLKNNFIYFLLEKYHQRGKNLASNEENLASTCHSQSIKPNFWKSSLVYHYYITFIHRNSYLIFSICDTESNIDFFQFASEIFKIWIRIWMRCSEMLFENFNMFEFFVTPSTIICFVLGIEKSFFPNSNYCHRWWFLNGEWYSIWWLMKIS